MPVYGSVRGMLFETKELFLSGRHARWIVCKILRDSDELIGNTCGLNGSAWIRSILLHFHRNPAAKASEFIALLLLFTNGMFALWD